VLAFALVMILVPRLKAANPSGSDILMQVLGGTADLASDAAYKEADVYFHGGVTGGCPHEDKDHCEDEAAHNHAMPADLPLMGVVERLHSATAPTIHRHLQGRDERELLPWFMAAVRLNPHNIEAWRTGTYWFYRTGDTKQAESFITDAIRANPNDYRVYMERGVLHHRIGKWSAAVQDLEIADRLWKNDSEDSPYDKKMIRTFHDNAKTHL